MDQAQQAQQAVRQRRLTAALLEIAGGASICFPSVGSAAMGASRVHFDVLPKNPCNHEKTQRGRRVESSGMSREAGCAPNWRTTFSCEPIRYCAHLMRKRCRSLSLTIRPGTISSQLERRKFGGNWHIYLAKTGMASPIFGSDDSRSRSMKRTNFHWRSFLADQASASSRFIHGL